MYDFLYNIIIYIIIYIIMYNNFQNLNLLKTNNRYMIAIEILLDVIVFNYFVFNYIWIVFISL